MNRMILLRACIPFLIIAGLAAATASSNGSFGQANIADMLILMGASLCAFMGLLALMPASKLQSVPIRIRR